MPSASKQDLLDYIQKHGIEEMVVEMVESLLLEKPNDPSDFWRSKLEQETLRDLNFSGNQGKRVSLSNWKSLEVPSDYLSSLFDSTKRITAEINPKRTIELIIEEAVQLLKCDRAHLFLYEGKSSLHWFDPSLDRLSGSRTVSLLAMPIIDYERQSLGVLQVINKKPSAHTEGRFTPIDELLLAYLTQQAGIALRNAELYREAIRSTERANVLLEMLKALSQDLGAQSTILTISLQANRLVQADRCTVFLLDKAKEEIWSLATDSGKEIRVPCSAGIAGESVSTNQSITIPDAYEDLRFNKEFDKKTGYRTKSILAVPIRKGNQVFGVIQMINKLEFDGGVGEFDEEDKNVIETFADFVASKLEHSSLFKKAEKHTEGDLAFQDLKSEHLKDKQKIKDAVNTAVIREEDEEEDA